MFLFAGCGISGSITSLYEDSSLTAWKTKIIAEADVVNVMEGDGLTVLSGIEAAAKEDVVFQWEITPRDNRFVAFSGSGRVLSGKKSFSFSINTVEDSLHQGDSTIHKFLLPPRNRGHASDNFGLQSHPLRHLSNRFDRF